MQADPVDVVVHGHRLRLVVDDPGARAATVDALAAAVVDVEEDAGSRLALRLGGGPDAGGLWVVSDRAGVVLGRLRRLEEAIAVVAGLLGSFAPVPDGCVRLCGRAVDLGGGRVVLGAAPVLLAPPMVERKLARQGRAVIDRLALDVDPATRAVTLPRALAGRFGDPGPGHLGELEPSARLAGVLVMAMNEAAPSLAQLVAELAALVVRGPGAAAMLDAAERLAGAGLGHSVPWNRLAEAQEEALSAIAGPG